MKRLLDMAILFKNDRVNEFWGVVRKIVLAITDRISRYILIHITPRWNFQEYLSTLFDHGTMINRTVILSYTFLNIPNSLLLINFFLCVSCQNTHCLLIIRLACSNFWLRINEFPFFGLLSEEHEDPNFDWRRSGKNCEEADGCKFIPRKAIAGFCSSLTFPPFLIVRVWIGGSR